MRKSPRDRRLQADFEAVKRLSHQSSIFSFESSGDSHQRYRMFFAGRGLARASDGRIGLADKHEVVVELGAAYPRLIPQLAWQTPVFHPNISNNGVVCLGGYATHWVPSLTLDKLCSMLWDMIRYKNYDIESPYNRDAALWIRTQNQFSLPLDARSIRDPNNGVAADQPHLLESDVIETGIEIVTSGSDEITFLE